MFSSRGLNLFFKLACEIWLRNVGENFKKFLSNVEEISSHILGTLILPQTFFFHNRCLKVTQLAAGVCGLSTLLEKALGQPCCAVMGVMALSRTGYESVTAMCRSCTLQNLYKLKKKRNSWWSAG